MVEILNRDMAMICPLLYRPTWLPEGEKKKRVDRIKNEGLKELAEVLLGLKQYKDASPGAQQLLDDVKFPETLKK